MTVLEHIKELALNLTPEEKDALAEYLADSNGEKPPEKPQSLRGDWSDAFSDDFDVDAESNCKITVGVESYGNCHFTGSF